MNNQNYNYTHSVYYQATTAQYASQPNPTMSKPSSKAPLVPAIFTIISLFCLIIYMLWYWNNRSSLFSGPSFQSDYFGDLFFFTGGFFGTLITQSLQIAACIFLIIDIFLYSKGKNIFHSFAVCLFSVAAVQLTTVNSIRQKIGISAASDEYVIDIFSILIYIVVIASLITLCLSYTLKTTRFPKAVKIVACSVLLSCLTLTTVFGGYLPLYFRHIDSSYGNIVIILHCLFITLALMIYDPQKSKQQKI